MSFPRFEKAYGCTQMGRNSTGELVQEIPQESKITELQVPPLVQVPATADRLALSLGFRLTRVQQRHATAGSQDRRTLRLAVQVNGCVGGGLLPQGVTSFRPYYYYQANFEEDCNFNEAKEQTKQRVL